MGRTPAQPLPPPPAGAGARPSGGWRSASPCCTPQPGTGQWAGRGRVLQMYATFDCGEWRVILSKIQSYGLLWPFRPSPNIAYMSVAAPPPDCHGRVQAPAVLHSISWALLRCLRGVHTRAQSKTEDAN